MTGQIPYVSRPQAEEFLNAFAAALEQPSQHPLVFHVWGIGGVGKSTLTRKVKEVHQSKAQLAEVSFGLTEDIEAPIPLMAKLYEQLPDGNGWGDPFLDQYELYWKTIHKLETEAVSGRGTVGEEQSKQVKDLLKLGVDVAGEFFLSESTKKIAETVVERGTNAAIASLSLKDNLQQLLQQHKATRRNKQLQELMLNPLARLTEAFVAGLRQRAEQKPIILVLDTYEKAPSEIDTWLWRTLLANAVLQPHAIRLVVAGRHCVLKTEGWRKLQQDRNLVDERDINRFDLDQTQRYLKDIGIEAENTIQQIFSATKGLPYYLNWIREERIRGREPDFSQGNEAIVNLLLQGLNQAQKRVVQLAACCRWFDRRLIQYLMEQQGLDFATAADEKLNCYSWLTQQTFVEFAQNYYRLDDVARDVFRLSLWQDDREVFHQVHQGLSDYFKAESDQEVSPSSSPPARYENPEWRKLRAEFLYHLLFSRNADGQHSFRSHLLEARYLRQDEVVQLPLQAITAEMELAHHPLLPHAIRQFLSQVRPAVERGWAVLEEEPIDYLYNQEHYGLSKAETDRAVQVCLEPQAPLTELAKFAALFYASKRCLENQRLDRLLKAKEQVEQIATSDDPEFSSGLFLWSIGNALSALGRNEEAIASYEQALALKPDKHEAFYNRGFALYELGRKEEAIASFDQALAIEPNDHETWYSRGVVLCALGRREEALKSYDQALKLKPYKYKVLYSRGMLLIDLSRYEEAIESFDQALKVRPYGHEALNNRGNVLLAMGRYEEAIESFDQALAIEPRQYRALNNRGAALFVMGRYEEAIESFDHLLEYEPDGHETWHTRGNVLLAMGRYEEATESFNRALELQPDDAGILYQQSCCYGLQGNIEAAIRVLQQAIDLDAKYREMAKTDSDFDNIRGDERFQALVNEG